LLQSQVGGAEAVWLSEFGGSAVHSLTRTEALALLALGQGLTRREIAAKLRLSPYTVSHYLTIGKEKLGAKTLVEAAVAVCLARTWASETSEAETSGGSVHLLDRLRRYNS
jgi:DNA-binding CsgD family transcriptional regulator